jgi:hypothetical protein
VFGIDFVQLRGTALWQKYEPQLVKQIGVIDTYRQSCGFDPVKTIERVTFAGSSTGPNTFSGVVVVRGVDSGRALECITKHAKQIGTVANDGGVLVIKQQGMDAMAVAAVDPMTVVVQVDATVNRETIGRVLRAGTPLRSSPTFMRLYERREAGASAWGMANGKSRVFQQAASMGINPKSVDGTLTVSDRFAMKARATFASADEAKKLADDANRMSAMARRFLDKLDIRADGPTVVVDGAITEAQLRTLMTMAGGMLGP